MSRKPHRPWQETSPVKVAFIALVGLSAVLFVVSVIPH
jgi:hypothetical protein